MANVDSLDAFKTNNEVVEIDANKRVRIGIIGTGWIAESHLRSILNQPDIDIVAGADLVEGKAEAFFKKFGGDKLISLNPEYSDIRINAYDEIICFGRVIGRLHK